MNTTSIQLAPPPFAAVLMLVWRHVERPIEQPRDPDAADAVFEALQGYVRTYWINGPTESPFTSRRFRRFVVGLLAPGGPAENMSLDDLAYATALPPELLLNWLLDDEQPVRPTLRRTGVRRT